MKLNGVLNALAYCEKTAPPFGSSIMLPVVVMLAGDAGMVPNFCAAGSLADVTFAGAMKTSTGGRSTFMVLAMV